MKDTGFSSIPFIILILIMVTLLGLLNISQSLCTLVAAWLLPTIIVTVIDDKPGRYLVLLVAIFNFAGITPSLLRLIRYRNDLNIVTEQILDDKGAWLLVYAYSACGWLIYHIVPVIAETFYKYKLKNRIAILDQQILYLKEEWGIEEVEEAASPITRKQHVQSSSLSTKAIKSIDSNIIKSDTKMINYEEVQDVVNHPELVT